MARLIAALLLITSLGVADVGAQCRRSGPTIGFPPGDTQPAPGADRSEALSVLIATLATAVPTVAGAIWINSSDPDKDPSPVPAWLMLGGTILGPSAGHFYAGCPQRAWSGVNLRWKTAAVGSGAAVMIMLLNVPAVFGGDPPVSLDAIEVVMWATGAVLATSSIVDIARTPRSVATRNMEREIERARASLTLTLDRSGRPGIGLRVPF